MKLRESTFESSSIREVGGGGSIWSSRQNAMQCKLFFHLLIPREMHFTACRHTPHQEDGKSQGRGIGKLIDSRLAVNGPNSNRGRQRHWSPGSSSSSPSPYRCASPLVGKRRLVRCDWVQERRINAIDTMKPPNPLIQPDRCPPGDGLTIYIQADMDPLLNSQGGCWMDWRRLHAAAFPRGQGDSNQPYSKANPPKREKGL
jgi:hypothetical protein